MSVADYSTTPGSNGSISGINIAENCPAGNMNGALRQLMADVRVFYDGVPAVSTLVTKTGGVFTGNPTFIGRGGYLHNNEPTSAGGRVFTQASGGGTPSGMVDGDWLAEY